VSDYELLQDVTVGTKPREAKETEGAALDHTSVAKAVEHGRPEALGARGAMHLQRAAGNAAMGALVQRKEEESPVKDVVGKGGGTSLDDGVRKKMESSLGHDFSDVKVHTGSSAATAAKSVQAQAFTVGNDVVFNEGKYEPSTAEGQHRIAHELTHVVQQRSGSVPGESREGGIKVSDPGDWAEKQAEATASAVMSGDGAHAGHDHAPAGAGAGVQRETEEPLQALHDPTIQRESEGEEEEVQSMAEPTAQRESEGEEEEVQSMAEPTAQRESEGEEEEVQSMAEPTAQREGEGPEEEAEEG
jgi:hypothetical protein